MFQDVYTEGECDNFVIFMRSSEIFWFRKMKEDMTGYKGIRMKYVCQVVYYVNS